MCVIRTLALMSHLRRHSPSINLCIKLVCYAFMMMIPTPLPVTYIIDIGSGEWWEKNCQNIEFTTAQACIAKFSNSLSFPCREFLLAIFPVFHVFPVPWVPGNSLCWWKCLCVLFAISLNRTKYTLTVTEITNTNKTSYWPVWLPVIKSKKKTHDHRTIITQHCGTSRDVFHLYCDVTLYNIVWPLCDLARLSYDTLRCLESQPGFWTSQKLTKTSRDDPWWLRRRATSHDSPPMVRNHRNLPIVSRLMASVWPWL